MIVELKNINKSYLIGDKIFPVLSGTNLTLNPGDRIHLRGRNGSGKTTLLRIISGDLKPDGGKVTRNCNDQEIALLSQAIPTYVGKNLTIAEHIALGLVSRSSNPFRTAVNADVIETVRLIVSKFGIGLENRLFDFVGNLSGGEAQLIGITTVLSLKPRILCLDEPSAALDFRVSVIVADMLKNFSSEAGLIFVAHNEEFAEGVRNKIIEL
jgi:polar amino acid transport system ATP-binding protein